MNSYPTYQQVVPQIYNTNDYYHKDFYYQPQQQQSQQSYNQFANINTCLSPSLSPPSIHNNFDQISNASPRNDYIFNGDFALNFNTDFDASFPLIDAKSPQLLFDHQATAPVDVGQLTPTKIESHEIKNSFSSDEVVSDASCSPSATTDWRFTEQ
jgi:hypothetical protein